VLEDGSVAHINKTTISDTDEDGNTFIFHKSVVVVRGDSETNADEEDPVEDIPAEEENTEILQVSDFGVDEGLRS
jgi:hypothetical protein